MTTVYEPPYDPDEPNDGTGTDSGDEDKKNEEI